MIKALCNIAFLWILSLVFSNCSTREDSTLFRRLSSNDTGITFNNLLDEDEQINVNNYMNIYTGGGVAAGDVNNDGLVDLFFSGNAVSSRLYLNKGNLQFEDITESSGVLNKRWSTGAIMADVNQDGWIDIYVCVSGSGADKRNMLFINNKNNTFTESGEVYGVADERQSMHASYFDYDGDEDLDLFIITNPASFENNVNNIQPRKLKGEGVSTDVLYRNNGDNTFTDVSKEAGILVEGYSLGLAISDINNDGWPDIYISNDFIGNDILYINNQNGTFTNRSGEYFKHTSFAGMGNDIADINNDGLVDVVELDMRPEDNRRQKLIIPPTGYDKFKLSLKFGYEPQFSRNTLQLNRGEGKFSEISFVAGVSSTDWSWSALLADYDNDGDKDLFATNGFLRDLGNMDYITYQNIYNTPLGAVQAKTDKKLSAIKELEGAILHNYIFENQGALNFHDRSADWGFDSKEVSHGAVYADLDNDGDLELIVNNMNEVAHVYENRTNELFKRNFLRIKFNGSRRNKDGIGAKVLIYAGGKTQLVEHYLNRGYESTVDGILHVGLDSLASVDSLIVFWPGGKRQTLKAVEVNRTLELKYDDAINFRTPLKTPVKRIFSDASVSTGINFVHTENDFIDFKVQPLLPHMHSKNGPGITVADINGDDLDDVYIGGTTGHSGALYFQVRKRTFKKQSKMGIDSLADQMGVLFFDADNDGDNDLYISRGGSEHVKESGLYSDQLYINNGSGEFSSVADALPVSNQSTSVVTAADYDHDGDLDLFVGGRIIPGQYPLPADSYILRNDSGNGVCKFTNVSDSQAPAFAKLGLVTSALWTDVDNDGWQDLMIVGEFMKISCFRNIEGKSFAPYATESLMHTAGWWNSIVSGDFDQDGDTDYVAGNLGLNTRYKASAKEPLCLYAKDYDKNGSIDPIMTYYLQGEKYIVHARDELISQIAAMRQRFRRYKDYSEATFDKSFLPAELESAYVVCSEWMASSYIENQGEGKFAIRPLPLYAQFAPVYGMKVDDYDDDGFLDIVLGGNLHASEINTGSYDASIGLMLKGKGQGDFDVVDAGTSGIVADGDVKGMASLIDGNSSYVLLIGNNSNAVSVLRKEGGPIKFYKARAQDAFAIVKLNNGKTFKHEFSYGCGYLSASSRRLILSPQVTEIEVVDFKGARTKINQRR